ncbi:MAG: hypothetical protein EP333_01345 [Bacteroidetes bacterium]|nr:MAG: hypothetical protein EP333_01345 [Bacteroidota bacterium]TNE96848.1 MAG: hypothetical protein EP322_07700 [Bacteroidota bacterium]
MNYLLPKNDLSISLKRVDFERKTRIQIAKDFATQDLYFSNNFEDSTGDYNKLINEISELLIILMKKGERPLLQLLYTIDLPEKYFLEIVQDPQLPELLAELILRREAYKIYLREKFS